MPILRLSKKEKRKFSVFIACVIAAIASWLFFALSAFYQFTVQARIHYKNVPAFRSVHPLQPGIVNVNMEAAGWYLLLSKFKSKEHVIGVDLQEVAKRNFVTFSNQLNRINKDFKPGKVTAVSPDTLFFDFSKNTVKKVPLKLVSRLDFENQYNISGKTAINPDSVTLTGPADALRRITEWQTDSLIVKKVRKDVLSVVATKASGVLNINVFPSTATVAIPVGEFTETTLDVPLKVFNNHEYEVKLLPEKVRITFMVSLKDFRSSGRNSFTAGVDFNQWLLQKYNELPVMLRKVPAFVKVIKYEPQTVDFIIKE